MANKGKSYTKAELKDQIAKWTEKLNALGDEKKDKLIKYLFTDTFKENLCDMTSAELQEFAKTIHSNFNQLMKITKQRMGKKDKGVPEKDTTTQNVPPEDIHQVPKKDPKRVPSSKRSDSDMGTDENIESDPEMASSFKDVLSGAHDSNTQPVQKNPFMDNYTPS